jgi:hypothetical protein
MRPSLPLLLGAALLLLPGGLPAQSSQGPVITAPTRTTPPPREATPRTEPAPRRALPPPRAVIPDPELFDGSKFPPEQRSEHGMVADFEVAGSDQASASDTVGGGGSAGGGAPAEATEEGGGGGAPAQGGGEEGAGEPPTPGGGGGGEEGADDLPETDAAGGGGMQIAQPPDGGTQGPGGAAAVAGTPVDPAPAGRPAREVGIGAPEMQIALPPSAQKEIVGGRQTDQQQEHERAMPRGQQSDNRNRGVERGANIPSDI